MTFQLKINTLIFVRHPSRTQGKICLWTARKWAFIATLENGNILGCVAPVGFEGSLIRRNEALVLWRHEFQRRKSGRFGLVFCGSGPGRAEGEAAVGGPAGGETVNGNWGLQIMARACIIQIRNKRQFICTFLSLNKTRTAWNNYVLLWLCVCRALFCGKNEKDNY